MMETYDFILILICNFLVYFISFFIIVKNRNHSVISVRSPTLLILNNFGGLLMTSIYISYEMIENLANTSESLSDENIKLFCRIIPNNYIICHILMMISFILRCHRIIECCKINYDERTDINIFLNRRYLFQETYYIKILFSLISIFILINLIIDFQFSELDLSLIPYHFKMCMKRPETAQSYVALSWSIINFIEDVILITYTFLIYVNSIKQLIKFELFAFMIIWIIYPNVLRFADFYLDADNVIDSHWTGWICCIFLWICLILNGYLPIFISMFDKSSLSYHFNPKLANNLYLFLSNEICFNSFYEFIKYDEELYYLNLYIFTIKYKFKYTTEPDYSIVLKEAKEIYHSFFSLSENFIDVETTNRVKSICQMLNKDECTYDMFDDALMFVYQNLLKIYKRYKRSEDYQILIDNLNLNSYVQCKMCNIGLISNF